MLLLLLSLACNPTDGKSDSQPPATTASDDGDGDGFTVDQGDCDDGDADSFPGAEEVCDGLDNDCDGTADEDLSAIWYPDEDGDGAGNATTALETCDPPEGALPTGGDCDDGDPAIHPDAAEVCDGVDNDCDGDTDESGDLTSWADSDGDGWGDPDTAATGCDVPPGYVTDASDCDDADAAIHPDADEVCDEADNDCDGLTDEDVTSTFYADLDGDGYGTGVLPLQACSRPFGYAADATDCDDGDAAVNPAATESCNGVDDDCDGAVDEDDAASAPIWYLDADRDGYGDAGSSYAACDAPAGYVADATDCDDANNAVSPSATEVCDGTDNDCDGAADEPDAAGAPIWYLDADRDGYGYRYVSQPACAQPAGYVADDTDCDDGADAAHPGAVEICDYLDNDCDGQTDEDDATDALIWYADADADSFGDPLLPLTACTMPPGTSSNALDCDDGDLQIYPGSPEYCDGADNDCDGAVDEPDAINTLGWYADGDGDGWGDGSALAACDAPAGYVGLDGDCDDGDAASFPGGTEVCDGADNDCDGAVDDGATDAATFYADLDGDGYGDPARSATGCAAPAGYVSGATDCDDLDGATHPGAAEVCGGGDDDCDGLSDEADPGLIDASAWYADSDGDGYGDPAASALACAQPAGYVSDATDCDDGSAARSPGNAEVWYDGVDGACDGGDDYDQDGDGDRALAWGGTDCDDTDPAAYGGRNCRPVVSCTHPSAATLAAYDASGISDIAFDGSCGAWLPTLISGQDFVYRMTSTGATTRYDGTSNHNIGSVAVDSAGSAFAVGYNNVNYVGYRSGSSIPVIATGSTVTGSAWSNSYLNQSPSSIALSAAGDVIVPNLAGSGTLQRVTPAGARTTIFSGAGYVESVGYDSAGELFVSIGASIYHVDATGARTLYYTAPATVLDFVFDYNDDLYVESGGRIEVLPDGGTASLYSTVSGQGKLAIAPDGWLVRITPNPVGAASYQEWDLE